MAQPFRKALNVLTVLAFFLASVGCTHFPKEPVSRAVPTGQSLKLSTTRVCEGEATAIDVAFKNPGALTYSVANEQGEAVHSGPVTEAFTIDTKAFVAGRYQVKVVVDADNTLEVGFEVFRCRT